MAVIKEGFKQKIFAAEATGIYQGYEEVVGRTNGTVYHELNLMMPEDGEVLVLDHTIGKLVKRKVQAGQRIIVNKPENFNPQVDFTPGDMLHVCWKTDPADGINKLVIELV